MNETDLFSFLETQAASVLLGLLRTAYDQMDRDQRHLVFDKLNKTLSPAPVDGEALLDEVEDFRRESMAGVYYATFKINSKNWSRIPDETREWFDTSLAATATPAEFTAAALPLIRSDSWNSFASQVYASAAGAANTEQLGYLEAEIQRQKIKTGIQA